MIAAADDCGANQIDAVRDAARGRRSASRQADLEQISIRCAAPVGMSGSMSRSMSEMPIDNTPVLDTEEPKPQEHEPSITEDEWTDLGRADDPAEDEAVTDGNG